MWGMKRGMTIEHLKCRADLNVKFDFGVNFWRKKHWYDCDQVGSYFIRIMGCFHPKYIFF